MEPILEEQDMRPTFDIHAYGDRILKNLDMQGTIYMIRLHLLSLMVENFAVLKDTRADGSNLGRQHSHTFHKFEDILVSKQESAGG